MPSRIQIWSCLTLLLSAPAMIAAQVTHGKKPQFPPPYATKSSANAPSKVSPPAGFLPTVPAGFKINVFATGFKTPRWLIVAPNGDIFLADMGAGEIVILRDPQNTGGAQARENFVTGLTRPFGIAFHDDYVYVGEMKELVRFKYDPKTSKRLGVAEHLMNLPGGGHDTRSVVFSKDGKHLFIGVGSESNVSPGEEPIRAAVTICDPDGKNARRFATGLRNPVGLALEPATGQVWTAVNERDELGDDLPPDYFTSLKDGGFYGWPYSYIGDNVDARVKPQARTWWRRPLCRMCCWERTWRRCSLRSTPGRNFRRATEAVHSWLSMDPGTARHARDTRSRLWPSRTGSLRLIRCRS